MKYGSKDKEGSLIVDAKNNIVLNGEELRKFAEELSELTNMDLQVGSINIDDLGEDCELTAEELIFLDDLIEG